jgi:hypothetical protein
MIPAGEEISLNTGPHSHNFESFIDNRVGFGDQFEPRLESIPCRVVELFRPERSTFSLKNVGVPPNCFLRPSFRDGTLA